MAWVEGLFGAAGLRALFTWSIPSFPPCHLKVIHEGRGWPWNRQILCHTTMEGAITVRPATSQDIPSKKATVPAQLQPPDKPSPKIGF